MKHDFTIDQMSKIHDFVAWAHKCNNSKDSDSKVEMLQMYKDKDNSFFASYFFHGYRSGQQCSCAEYVQIDRKGKKTDMRDTYPSTAAIAVKFQKLEPITF